MSRVLIATRNPGKVRELAAALARAGLDAIGLDAVDDNLDVAETGATFEANARLKAETWSRATGWTVVADDSGLEVDALDGAPGVRSARFGGSGLGDHDRVRALLEALGDVSPGRRSARFRCVLAVAKDGVTIATFEGVVEGRIAQAPAGSSGFGYDPVFVPEGSTRTFAEMTRDEKLALSHRGRATTALLAAVRSGALSLDDPDDPEDASGQ